MAATARQIADDFRDQIQSGELGPGARLPGEPKLREVYGVAKETANSALNILVNEGLATRRRGSGTYVREFRPIRRSANRRLSQATWAEGRSIWGADLGDRELTVADVQVHEEASAPQHVARALGRDADSPVIVRSRRFLVDGEPVQMATSFLPAELVRETAIAHPDTGPGGTYARLGELGLAPAHFVEEVRARMPLKSEADALAIAAGTPVVEICRTAITEDGQAVEVNQMLLDAGVYVLEYRFDS